MPKKILIVDAHPTVELCSTAPCPNHGVPRWRGAATAAAEQRFDGILVHRAGEMDIESLILSIRGVAPDAPIIALSGFDRSKEALAAGATKFLNYDQWLLMGTAVEDAVIRAPR